MAPPGDEGESWDDGTWVDVDSHHRWHPSFEERSRALVIIAVVVGALSLLAAFASIDDGDGDDEATVSATSTTGVATTAAETTTTTEAPAPASVDGEDPPPECGFDDREARPLRPKPESTVLVLNGTPRSGHAGATTDDLEDLGYTSMTPGNASIQEITTIAYLPGHCAEAVRLRDDLGVASATVEPIDPNDDEIFLGRAVLLVTLGRDTL